VVTMADVARVAGVSTTTVSHVINRSRRVSDETRLAVEAAIAQAGYVPDQVARAIRTGDNRTLGVALSMSTNPYFGAVVNAIERAATSAGYSILLSDTHDEPASQATAVATLLSRRVGGVILAPVGDPRSVLAQAQTRGVPVTVIDRFIDAGVDQVGSENSTPTAALVDHLADLGHTRIAMVTGRAGVSTSRERLDGYLTTVARRGLDDDDLLVVDGESSTEGGAAACERLLDLAEPPSAMVVGNNAMTLGAVQTLRRRRVRVPSDMALVSFDDFEWADCFEPRLTVARQAIPSIGERAVELLVDRIRDPDRPLTRDRFSADFVHRNSCGCS
jgi:LacI family transcriptional regulator